MKQTKTITETMRVVDDDGNIIKTGDPETDAVSEPAERTEIQSEWLLSNMTYLNYRSANLVPRVSYLTELAPGGGKMRDPGNGRDGRSACKSKTGIERFLIILQTKLFPLCIGFLTQGGT